MPPAGPRGPARGLELSTAPAGFRCSLASEERGDDAAGTATHLNAFVVLEDDGPWGESAPRDSRLPEVVKRHLAGHRAVKVLLARRHHRDGDEGMRQVMLCFPARRLLLRTTVEDPRQILDLDLGPVSRGLPPAAGGEWAEVPGPVYGVCTHGRHDACCAERGRPVCRALTAARPDQTWEFSHVGGDRFAPNMLVLPEGHYYGRLDPESVLEVAALHESGRVDLDRWRGRASYQMASQHAEIALRRHLDEDRLDGVRLVAVDGQTHDFRHGEDTWRVTVTRTLSQQAQLTCSAVRPGWVPVFEATAITLV